MPRSFHSIQPLLCFKSKKIAVNFTCKDSASHVDYYCNQHKKLAEIDVFGLFHCFSFLIKVVIDRLYSILGTRPATKNFISNRIT